VDLSHQLRAAEKASKECMALVTEVETLVRNDKTRLDSDLKDMVEQGLEHKVMVEDLSDWVLSLEEELVTLQQMIREIVLLAKTNFFDTVLAVKINVPNYYAKKI
jgi:hypothetical protein